MISQDYKTKLKNGIFTSLMVKDIKERYGDDNFNLLRDYILSISTIRA